MGAASLGGRIGKPTSYAADLLRLHRQTYPSFWAWSDGAESHAMLLNRLHTAFGWTVRIGSDANPRSLRNFPCQANGAEMMLRLACCLATEWGVSIVAPIHDAVLVEGPDWEIDDTVAETQAAMGEASAVILDGFRLRFDAAIVRWPGRYMDDRGREFWGRVCVLLPNELADCRAGRTMALPSPPSACTDPLHARESQQRVATKGCISGFSKLNPSAQKGAVGHTEDWTSRRCATPVDEQPGSPASFP